MVNMAKHPNNDKVTLCCPCCGSKDLTEGRSAYVEIGALDEDIDEYEDEFNVTEYDCNKCFATFFL